MSDPILSDIDSNIHILGCVYGPFAKFGVLGSLYSLYQQINGFCFYG